MALDAVRVVDRLAARLRLDGARDGDCTARRRRAAPAADRRTATYRSAHRSSSMRSAPHGTRTILPSAPGSITASCARGASASGNLAADDRIQRAVREAGDERGVDLGEVARRSTLNSVMPRIAASRPIACRASISTRPRLPTTTTRPCLASSAEIAIEVDVRGHLDDRGRRRGRRSRA